MNDAVDELKRLQKVQGQGKYSGVAQIPFSAADQSGADENTVWIEIELLDEDGFPIPGEKYEVKLPDGRIATGTLDENGLARVEGFEDGACQVCFPDLDKETWQRA